jgi:hypothetical protein
MYVHRLSRRHCLKLAVTTGLLSTNFDSTLRHILADDTESVLDIGSRRELFVDQVIIGELRGATVRMHQPTPRNVAIVHDEPWEGNASLYHTVFHDDDLFRMYYRGWNFDVSGETLRVSHRPVTCYAESRDGITWTKPNLGLFDYEGSRENNIVWDGVGTHNFSPFLDTNPKCSPDARYKALGGIKSEGGLHAFASADGTRWRPLSETPVITKGAFDSQNIAYWDDERGEYRSYQRDFRDGRDVTTSRSDDFVSWSEPEFLEYTPGRLTQLYTNQITPYYRAPHIRLGFPTRYITNRKPLTPLNERLRAITTRYGTDYTDGGFMTSRDGRHFRMAEDAFLRPGPVSNDRWVYGANYQNWGIVETLADLPMSPPELSMYASEAYWEGSGVRMRRYTLRLDGFMSVQAPLSGGELHTKLLQFSGSQLSINVSTSAAGGVLAELQDVHGKPLPGYSLADCPEIYGDKTDHVVTWTSGADLSQLAGRPVRLRFLLKDADLFAFKFGLLTRKRASCGTSE